MLAVAVAVSIIPMTAALVELVVLAEAAQVELEQAAV
jgi:hypothetical protein